jgi:hypothetical protein
MTIVWWLSVLGFGVGLFQTPNNNLKSPVRKSSRFNLVLRVHQNIVYLAALFADKMPIALD